VNGFYVADSRESVDLEVALVHLDDMVELVFLVGGNSNRRASDVVTSINGEKCFESGVIKCFVVDVFLRRILQMVALVKVVVKA